MDKLSKLSIRKLIVLLMFFHGKEPFTDASSS